MYTKIYRFVYKNKQNRTIQKNIFFTSTAIKKLKMTKFSRMASNQENRKLNQCKKRFYHGSETSFIIHIDINEMYNRRRNSNVQHFSQKISLTQEPCETLTLTLYIKRRNNITSYSCVYCGSDVPTFYVDLDLNFDNNLHEICQDYVYAIKLNILKEDSKYNHKYHINVFSHEEKRSKNVMSVKDKSLPNLTQSPLNTHHLCCSISRFNAANEPATEASLINNIGKMLLKHGSDYSDASLVVGDKIFPVHKLVLQSKSDVFKAMFTNDMSEAKSGIVKIDNIDAAVIEEMLEYIYTGKTEKMAELSQKLFQVAHKYQIIDLRAKCEEYFIFKLNYKNAVEILDLARVYELKSLRNSVEAFVTKHEEDMVKEKSYTNFLCRDLTADRIVSTLKLCTKYNLEKVKLKAFKVVQENKETFAVDQAFLDLLVAHPNLSKSFIAMLLLSIK